jgi:BON domain
MIHPRPHLRRRPGQGFPARRRPRLRARPRGSAGASALAVFLPATLLAAALLGCGRGTPVGGAGAASAHNQPAAPKAVDIAEDPVKTGIEAGDAGLAGRVRARLTGDPQLRALQIEVDAEGGRVTLWGHVGRAQDRAAVEQLVRRTPGVAGVTNLIKSDDAAPPA